VIGFLIRRLLQAAIVIIFVMLIMFLLVHVIPGGEARAVLGPRATQVQISQFQVQNGLTLPIWDQIIHYLWNLARFRLGTSPKLNQSVISLIGNHLPKTLILVGLATILAVVVAVPLGIYQVIRRYKPEDYVLTGLIFVLYAMPAFLLGTLLILWFAIYLPWFSVEGPQGQSALSVLADPRALVLPVLTVSAITIASFSRYMRSSMMDAMAEDYIRTARAKGASSKRVLFGHAFRNALIPIVTLLGLNVGSIVSGAVITESVFNYPGMGLLTITAAFNDDVPTLLGAMFVITVATIAGNFLADVMYAIVDPRIRFGRA
jgi:peptide/nickel transport system permease protein